MLRGPETLYDTVTRGAANTVTRALPASKGEVRDNEAKLEAYKATSEEHNAVFEEYRNETTGIINALVGKLNSLTPVSISCNTPLERPSACVSSIQSRC